MASNKLRIYLKAYDYTLLDESAKRIAVYKFKVATKSGIIENIIKTMESIPGATTYTYSTTVTKPAVQ